MGQFPVNRFGYPGLQPGLQYAGCWEFDSQSVKLDMSECVELGVSESEELPVGGLSRHLTLHLCGHCLPIVSKPFTAIFLYPILLLSVRYGMGRGGFSLCDPAVAPAGGQLFAIPPRPV